MFTPVRSAMGIAFVAILITSITALAKGGFDFIQAGWLPSLYLRLRGVSLPLYD